MVRGAGELVAEEVGLGGCVRETLALPESIFPGEPLVRMDEEALTEAHALGVPSRPALTVELALTLEETEA